MWYVAVAAGSFRRYATYRIATMAGVFTNTVFGFIVAYTYIALWDERPHLGGYDQAQALAFVWTAQALLATAALMGGGGWTSSRSGSAPATSRWTSTGPPISSCGGSPRIWGGPGSS